VPASSRRYKVYAITVGMILAVLLLPCGWLLFLGAIGLPEHLKMDRRDRVAQMWKQGEAAVPDLIKVLQGEEIYPYTRDMAIYSLGAIGAGARDAVPELIRILQDPNENDMMAYSAVEALGSIGDETAIPALVDAMTSSPPERDRMCYRASLALGAIGPPAVPALSQLLSHENVDVRRHSADALSVIGPAARDALPAIKRRMEDDTETTVVLKSMRYALRQIEPTPRTRTRARRQRSRTIAPRRTVRPTTSTRQRRAMRVRSGEIPGAYPANRRPRVRRPTATTSP
jgi:HEAT repeat protein